MSGDEPGEGDGDGAGGDAPAAVVAPATPRPRWMIPTAAGAALVVLIVAVLAARPTPTTPAVAAAPGTTPPPVTAGSTSTTTEAPPPTETTTTIAEPPGTTTTTRKPHITPTGPPGPLTGAPVDKPGYERRPALVVKIDNYEPDARPQAGLSHADIVYEEKVEGPYSRFAAIFQGSDAEQVGPVRSARSTDVQIVGPLNKPLFAYSGANSTFLALLSISPLIDVGAGARPNAYWRGGDKVIPHNLYTSTANLFSGQLAVPPVPPWSFRTDDKAPAGSKPASGVAYQFGGGMTSVSWTWSTEEKGFVRTQNGSTHFDQDNWPVTTQNIVIQYVRYQGAEARDVFGNPIPEALLGGTGRGWLLTSGVAAPLTWSRFGLLDRTTYAGIDNQPLAFAPGRTWVILVPVEYPARIQFTDGTAAS